VAPEVAGSNPVTHPTYVPLSPVSGRDRDAVIDGDDAGRCPGLLRRSSFSAQKRTVPFSVTMPPSTSTMFLASSSAVRTSASSIFFFRSDGVRRGLTTMKFVTALDARQPPNCLIRAVRARLLGGVRQHQDRPGCCRLSVTLVSATNK
jgi:hypothetical protein